MALLAGLLFAAGILAQPARPADAPAAGPAAITIGIVADNAPYSHYGPAGPEGFSIDILDEVSRLSGMPFEYRVGSWTDVYSAFLRGELDAVDEISWREDRAAIMLFTRPYHLRETVIMHDGSRPLPPVANLAQLKGHRIGILKDIYYTETLRAAGLDLTEYSLQSELVQALSFGWVDAIIGSQVTLAHFARERGYVGLEVLALAPLNGDELEDFRLAVSLDRPDLHAALDDALARLDPEFVANTLTRWQEFGGRALTGPQFRLTPAQQATLRQTGPVRLGLMRDYAPMSFEDSGQILGLTVDVFARIEALTGLRAVPVTGQWSQLIALFERGDIDIMANISDLPERRRYARFTEPYQYVPVVGFTRLPDLRLRSADDLAGLTVGYGGGIFYENALRQAIGPRAIPFDDQASMFLALQQGQVDVVLAALTIGNHWIRELKTPGVHVAGDLVLDTVVREDLRFAMRPGLEPLVPIVNQALAAITPTEQRVIENRWLGALSNATDDTPAALALTDAEQRWLAQRQHQLVLCSHPDWLPLEGLGPQGQHRGMAASLMQHFARRLNLRLTTHATPSWDDALAALRAGHCDLLAAAPEGLRDQPDLRLTTPYYHVPTVVLGRLETPFFSTLTDLAGVPLGISHDLALGPHLQQRHPGLNLHSVATEADGLRQVQAGALYGYIGTLDTSSQTLQNLELADVRVIGRVPVDTGLALATTVAQVELSGIMQKLVNQLSHADLNRMEGEWRTVRLQASLDTRLLWQIVAVSVVVLALLFLWIRQLRSLNGALAHANAQLALASSTDHLTGLGNRTRFDQAFGSTHAYAAAHGQHFMVAMLDADHFKQVNDRWGHEAGDACLKFIATTMQTHVQGPHRHVVRFGGEEFMIFAAVPACTDTPPALERLRAALASEPVVYEGQAIALTISIGYCCAAPRSGVPPTAWLRAADRALYEAKGQGRNRVVQGHVSGPANA